MPVPPADPAAHALAEAPDLPEAEALAAVSTGALPAPDRVAALVAEAHARFRDDVSGTVADYIPALACASPALFGICVTAADGAVAAAGDVDAGFSIQSVSKPFVFALAAEALGCETVRRLIGVNATGLPFNSVMAVELNAERGMNPMVNAGAIAATSLMPGETVAAKFEAVRAGLSRFAGRELTMDAEVHASEAETNQRNRGIAKLLEGYGRLYSDALEATEVYTRQCALTVTARDLSVMAATLADGGVNPLTRERVVGPGVARRVLAALATSGLYERSGDWLWEVGLPGKSGVSGGVFTVAPGKGGLGVFSPPLDAAGNSVRGAKTARFLSERLGLNLFASRPMV